MGSRSDNFNSSFSRTNWNCRKMLLSIILLVFASLNCVNCAKLGTNSSSTSESNEVKLKNDTTFSRKQGFVGFSGFPNSNLYLSTPPALYQSAIAPGFLQYGTPTMVNGHGAAAPAPLPPPVKEETKKSKRGSGSREKEESDDDDEEEEVKKQTKSKSKSRRKKHKKRENEEEILGTEIESKTIPESSKSVGTKRGCPACVSGLCDATLDPSTNISGIPVIQIIIAAIVGAFWAGIFIFFLVNFIEHDKGGGGYGGGYAPSPPQYGTPVVSYGAAPVSSYGAPSSDYGTPSSSYSTRVANRYGRSSPGFSFDEVSSWVWDGIDKVSKLYDNYNKDN